MGEQAKRNSSFGGIQEVVALEAHTGESQVCGVGEDKETDVKWRQECHGEFNDL